MTLPPFYASNIAGAAWPPVVRGSGAMIAALIETLEQTQWLPADDIRAAQFRQLAVIIAHFAQHSPVFAERLQQAGLTPAEAATPEGFAKLPPVGRRYMQEKGEQIYCMTVPESHKPILKTDTSGSTGQRVEIRKTGLTNITWAAMTMRSHDWAGRDFGKRHAAILAHVKEVRQIPDWGSPVNLFSGNGATLLMPVLISIEEQVRLMREFSPHYLLLSPSNLGGVMDECRKSGGPIKGLEGVTTINETLKPELRARAEDYLGVKIDDIYSSAEVGNMALQCPQSGLYHVMAEGVILEILDDNDQPCKPGDIGRVVVTDLHNHASPMIRYAIADYAEASAPCPCGRGLPTLKRIMGRERHLAVRPDGSRFWPSIGSVDPDLIAPAIIQAQYIQHAPDEIEARYVVTDDVTPEQERQITLKLHDVMQTPYKVRFTYFREKFPKQPSGKFEEFICKVQV